MFKFTEWYDKNKKALNERRKQRYKTDPAYREAILVRTASRRAALKTPTMFGSSVAEACESLGIAYGVLSKWKSKGLIPVDTLRGYKFSTKQIQLLNLYCQFFEQHPKGASYQKDKLQPIIDTVNHNWNE